MRRSVGFGGRLLLVAALLVMAMLVSVPSEAEAGAGRSAAVLAGPSADQLRAKVAGCSNQLSSGMYAQDAGGTRNIPVCKTGGAVHWTADLDIDCDGQQATQCNENTDPRFQPDTSWHQSDGRPLNSAGLPFIVVPLPSSTWDYKTAGIRGATVAAVVYQGKVAAAANGLVSGVQTCANTNAEFTSYPTPASGFDRWGRHGGAVPSRHG